MEQTTTNRVIVSEPIKKKKGRPRKDATIEVTKDQLVESEIKPEVEKKKRGRKKKEPVVEEIKQKKKRGRKAAVKYFSSSIRKQIPLKTAIQDNSSYILHLDIKEEDTKSSKVTYEAITNGNENGNNEVLERVFSKLTTEEPTEVGTEVGEFKKGIKEMLHNDGSILADYLEEKDEEIDLRELYEKRIEYREEQDQNLVNKLKSLHDNEEVIQTLLNNHNDPKSSDKGESLHHGQELNRKKGYFELLQKFVHNEHGWLENTDVHCWWCCHTFESLPLGLPVDFVHTLGKFRVRGVFCSFSCIMAYKNEKKIGHDSLVKYLCTKLTGKSVTDIKLRNAPPREALKMFGGELTIEEFRNSEKEAKIYKMIEYPMFPSRDYVEEVDIANVKSANNMLFDENSFAKIVNLDQQKIHEAKARLLQFEKTTVMVGNTIDKFINLT